MAQIWSLRRGLHKAYTEDIDVAKRIMRWNSVERCSIYHTHSMRIFAYDFIFPTRTYNRVAKAFGWPMKSKSIKRVIQGQRLQNVDRIAQVKSSILSSETVLK